MYTLYNISPAATSHIPLRILLSYAIGNPTEGKIASLLSVYNASPDHFLYGCSDEERQNIAVIGIRKADDGFTICHIAVSPSRREQGVATWMIQTLISHTHASWVYAETDNDAVDFYKKLGFTIERISELQYHTHRYRCTLRLAPHCEERL